MDSSLAVWSGWKVIAIELKLIPDTYTPPPTTWVTFRCQEPATGGASFLYNFSKCFLICHHPHLLPLWAASPSGCDHCFWTCYFSPCQVDQRYYTCKMNNQHFEEPFFAPKMSLLRVYFPLPIKQMLPALWGIFCDSQSLSLGGMPDAPALCRAAAHECQRGEWICLSDRKGYQSVAEHGGNGGVEGWWLWLLKMEKCKQV